MVPKDTGLVRGGGAGGGRAVVWRDWGTPTPTPTPPHGGRLDNKWKDGKPPRKIAEQKGRISAHSEMNVEFWCTQGGEGEVSTTRAHLENMFLAPKGT